MFTSKDKKSCSKPQKALTSKNNQTSIAQSLPIKTASDLSIEKFNHYKDLIAIDIANLLDEIKILKSIYQSYASTVLSSSEDKRQAKIKISKKIDEIYVMGKNIGNIFQQAKPELIFKNANLPPSDIAAYQFIYENLHASFKSAWINLYELKEKHSEHEFNTIKQLLIIQYSNASKQQINTAASYILEDETLSKNMLLMNAADFLSYAQRRHNKVIKLEKSLHEVNQLFIDLMVLTNNQGETIDHISENIESAKQKVKDSITDLSDAKADLGKCGFSFEC